MCGIAGAINFRFDPEIVNRSMGHRGPDARNSFQHEQVLLHHLRLAIVDIGGGAQPMHYLDRYTIIFNGEIFNYREVRERLQLSCVTNSDTEVLLQAYHAKGPAMLDELDGMFVFCIYDRLKNELFFARDRAGEKPLYYYQDESKFVFASELYALRHLLPLETNDTHIVQYLRLGSLYRESTPYQKVKELPGGAYMIVNCATRVATVRRWWNIADYYTKPSADDLPTALHKTDQLLNTAIQSRIESSDLEVGTFLSGGIDSGIVTAIASRYNHQLKTFTVSFNGAYDEAPLAKLVADKYQTVHTVLRISFDNLKHDIENILAGYGEPFYDSSAIPSYYLSRAARQYLTVILNGDGADELFAGYRRYLPFARYDFFGSGSFLRTAAGAVKSLLPKPHNKKSRYNYLYRLFAFASKPPLQAYLSASVDIFEDYESNINDGFGDYLAQWEADFQQVIQQPVSGLKKIMHLDFDTILFSDLLVKMDIATMQHSLEGRSPFLARDILQYAPTLSDKHKINGQQTKFLLRQLARQYLPEELINQPKRGFEIPLKDWVEGQLREIVFDLVGGANAISRKYVKTAFLQQLLEKKIRMSDEKRAKILWTLLSLEIWYRRCATAPHLPASGSNVHAPATGSMIN